MTRSHDLSFADAAVLLTRQQVAARLGVSLSTVRRLEGTRLPVVLGGDGIHRFRVAAVAALAVELAAEMGADPGKRARPGRRRNRAGQVAPEAPTARQAAPADLPPGELAARVFERLEQRQSLAEIVVGLRVAPALVRELHREWQQGLIEGELARPEPVLPAGSCRRARERHVDGAGLAALLAALPMGTRTRISLARDLGDDEMIPEPADPTAAALGWGELRRLVELGGFLAAGPIPAAEIARRYGAGAFRITAYGFDPPGVRWEVFAAIERDAEREALAAVGDLLATVTPPVFAPALEAPEDVEPPALEAPEDVAPPAPESPKDVAPPALESPEAVAPPALEAPEASAPWGGGASVLPVLGGRGLRAELVAATSPPSSTAPRPLPARETTWPEDWRAMLVMFAPGMGEPDPPGLAPAQLAAIAHARGRLAKVPPVTGPALVALRDRLVAIAADPAARVIDVAAPLWKATRARLHEFEQVTFDAFLPQEEMRRWIGMGGDSDPRAAVDAFRLLVAMTLANEIQKQRDTSSPTVDKGG